jgi:hypothetical protein
MNTMNGTQSPTLERLEDQISWYDAKSQAAQRWFKGLKIVQLVCAGLIPLVAVFDVAAPGRVTAILGLVILIVEGLQQLNQYQTNWISYRSTCEALRHEKYLFLGAAGPYAKVEQPLSLLAERIEAQISQENAQWGSVLELAEKAGQQAGPMQAHTEVARIGTTQEPQELALEAMIERYNQERAQLALEKPKEERLAFTVAYPPSVGPDVWHDLVVYLHLDALREEVMLTVRQMAGVDVRSLSHAHATRDVVRGTLLTLVPQILGLDINPASATVAWVEDIQDVRFRIRAHEGMAGQSAFGVVEVTLGSLPIAHLGIAINVQSDAAAHPAQVAQMQVYQDVFASYSSKDAAVVQACRAVYWGIGVHLVVDKQMLSVCTGTKRVM